jgi:hypothetical protein
MLSTPVSLSQMQKDGAYRVVYGTQLNTCFFELLQHFCAVSAGVVICWIV